MTTTTTRFGAYTVRPMLAAIVGTFLVGQMLAEVPPIAFVSRAIDHVPDPTTRERAIELAGSGKLVVREPSGELRVLVGSENGAEGIPVDVADPSVSFNGSRIVFAGYSETEGGWRIFVIGADGQGLRQITQSDRRVDLSRYGDAADVLAGYDDVDPCYLPDGRICFVSTRFVGVATDGRLRATNLYVVNADGTALNRITSERFGADTPAIEPATGRIVYSRFWRTAPVPKEGQVEPILPGSPGYENIVVEVSDELIRGITDEEFPGVNSWFLAGINPDGTNLGMWTGFRLDRELTQAYRPAFLASGEALAVFLPVTPFIGYPRGYGLRSFQPGPLAPIPLGGPQIFPQRFGLPPAIDYKYASAEGLPDGRLVVSAVPSADGVPDYAIYIQENAEALPNLLYNDPERFELDAVPLVASAVPPVVEDTIVEPMGDESPLSIEEAFELGGAFTFLCENIFFNAPVDVPIANAPPVGKQLAIEFYLASQRTSPVGADEAILIDRQVLPTSGRVVAQAPAGTPLFEVLRRPDGNIAMGRDGQIFHVAGANFGRVGGTARCVGCHAGHTQISVPEDATWTNLSTSATVEANSVRSHGRLNLQDFKATNVVDRRTGSPDLEWAAESGVATATLQLNWTTTLRAREIVLYGTRPGDGTIGQRNQTITGLTLAAQLRGSEQLRLGVAEAILPGGTKVPFDSDVDFDALSIRVESGSVSGLYEGRDGVALAEVEVIARDVGAGGASFLRGDSNCDRELDITDPVHLLSRLFATGGQLCCEQAADGDSSGELDITDAIFVLWFLFQGGPPPAGFPECAPVEDGSLTCDGPSCL